MVTDDERREVAERLRCAAEQGQPYTQPTLACFVGAGCADIWTRLADLIEPAPKCSEATPKCDRDALLGLARWAKSNAWYFALDHPEDELRDRLTEAAEYFSEVERSIREACGEAGA